MNRHTRMVAVFWPLIVSKDEDESGADGVHGLDGEDTASKRAIARIARRQGGG
jgi:hypothetical protein